MKRLLLIAIVVLLLTVGVASAQVGTTGGAITAPAGQLWAAWQPFSGGVMIWWSDTGQIWVLFNHNGPAVVYPDFWVASMGDPASSCAIPAVRGFGAVWQALGGQSGSLGCPLAAELGFDSAARMPGLPGTGEIIVDGPGNNLYGVTIAPGAYIGTWRPVFIG